MFDPRKVWGDWLRAQWCNYIHGGGDVKRDSEGRINWQCRRCGRWTDNPVPLDDEWRATEAAIARHLAVRVTLSEDEG